MLIPGYSLIMVSDQVIIFGMPQPCADLIDPATGTVRPGITRKYDPENWEDFAFQNSPATK